MSSEIFFNLYNFVSIYRNLMINGSKFKTKILGWITEKIELLLSYQKKAVGI